MSYQVLARKCRPKNFQQMVGQQHVLQALINALTQQRLHHAYLFTGTRGVGKTTIARLFAKCLNCETAITANPCGQCANCQAIEKGNFVDLIEVDAASRTSVDDTRELLDNVQYAATVGRFKVYLIDEVHMLSGHSFNALLKTLEEPPAHVKFLLATTDPQKLPATVLSRCLQFHLKNMLPEQIAQHLAHILQQEAINYETAALDRLAIAADGSMRDALSLLDQAIAYSDKQITTSAVHQMLGTIEQTHIHQLLTHLSNNNPQAIIDEINQLTELGSDFTLVLADLISELHQIALQQTVPSLNFNETIQQFAQFISKEDVQLWYQIALIGRRDLPLAPSAKIGLEMVLLRMLAFRPDQNRSIINTVTQSKVTPAVNAPTHLMNWSTILEQLKLSGPLLALASHCCEDKISDNHVELILEQSYKALLNSERQSQLTSAISQLRGKPTQLTIKIGQANNPTPSQISTQEEKSKQQMAQQIIHNDPHVQEIMQQFGARITEENSKS